MVNEAWRDEAACLGSPTDWFFPEDGEPLSDENFMALDMCSTCSVREECLDYAKSFPPRQRVGIWGGVVFGPRPKGPERRDTCGRGHTGDWKDRPIGEGRYCRACDREDKAAKYARQRGAA